MSRSRSVARQVREPHFDRRKRTDLPREAPKPRGILDVRSKRAVAAVGNGRPDFAHRPEPAAAAVVQQIVAFPNEPSGAFMVAWKRARELQAPVRSPESGNREPSRFVKRNPGSPCL